MTAPTGHGLDISEFQGAVDYPALIAAHPAIVGIRSSFGTSGVDGRFSANRAGLSAKVPLLLLYHFAYPNANGGTSGAQREAGHFCDTVGSLRPGEAAALDWETAYSGDHVAWVDAWWAVVEQRLGVKRPDEWEYGSASTLYGLRTDAESTQRHLWLAVYPTGGGDPNNPPPPPPGFARVDIWQHGGGNWPGVSGSVDDDWVYTPQPSPHMESSSMFIDPNDGKLWAPYVSADGRPFAVVVPDGSPVQRLDTDAAQVHLIGGIACAVDSAQSIQLAAVARDPSPDGTHQLMLGGRAKGGQWVWRGTGDAADVPSASPVAPHTHNVSATTSST